MKISVAFVVLALLGFCSAVPSGLTNQDLDVDELINRLQQWRQSLSDEYENEMPQLLQRMQRAPHQRFNYPPLQSLPYRGFLFGERSHRSLDSLGGGNLLKRSPVDQH